MKSLTYLIIAAVTLTAAHLTRAGFIEDRLIQRSELYYISGAGNGESIQIPLAEVERFRHNRLVLYLHGYIANPKHDSVLPIRNGLLAAGDFDVIAGDWSAAALLPYPQARSLVEPVGKFFYGKLSPVLTKHNISFANVICVGHSLGAHACGNLGRASGGLLGTLIGLDPAKPLISVDAPDCLQKTNARKVHNLHTGSPLFGQLLPLGHVDVYPNFGEIQQPGCKDPASVADFFTKGNACSHNRACQIFGESLVSIFNFPAVRCQFAAIEKKSVAQCQETKLDSSSLHNDIANRNVNENIIFFGLGIPESANGTFIMDTNPRSPFGMGASYRLPVGYV